MKALLLPTILLLATSCAAQTRQDTLRGNNWPARAEWDVRSYQLNIMFDSVTQNISGTCRIKMKSLNWNGRDVIQIDLQEPMVLDSAVWNCVDDDEDHKIWIRREGNAHFLHLGYEDCYKVESDAHLKRYRPPLEKATIKIFFHGRPRDAKNAPWDGGFVRTKDANGNLWAAVACQGLGASSWWPCKDYQGDEPEEGMSVTFRHSNPNLSLISNGIHRETWSVKGAPMDSVSAFTINYPINLYNLTFYLGDYTTFTDTFHGEGGVLPLTFHPLRYNESKARKHFAVVKDMLRCFEHWMGPYPFYEDGYKLVEAPYLGMEHQSAIAYGNGYQMGYLGRDRSGTGVGMLFDYIIIHESGHEWFGNNITAKDVADNWIHEGFTTYTETLYAEWIAGKEKAARYNKGEWKNIENDRPIIGNYGINDDGSGDKYDKGTAILHMIRTMIKDDEVFRQILRGLNKDFRHQTVTTKQVEDYIDDYYGRDLRPFFQQYLRTTAIPRLEWYKKKGRLHYRFTNVVPGFTLPVSVKELSGVRWVSEEWASVPFSSRKVEWEDNFLIEIDKVSAE